MTDKAPDLTDAERDICQRSGMDPTTYRAIRDTETHYGGRNIIDVLAAIAAAKREAAQ